MAATASLTALAQRIPSATLRLGSADVTQAGLEVSVNTVKFKQNVSKILIWVPFLTLKDYRNEDEKRE